MHIETIKLQQLEMQSASLLFLFVACISTRQANAGFTAVDNNFLITSQHP